ncbi:hydrogen peroxide-dependent heme synthase [Salinibacterium sp. SWN248]|uniref:hydrogen peroxide-dependent heme synthase n=1 Tax=Salinibacterium sp. SWN248 TaxID=2792056 RepID=UPI0018CF2E19|nr:hydrogen peroxide-dependent heme synthase [Salinibacterium sp. SWN248]MBH0022681.1 chlorite dismutase family protein [Salinibacterium sp. SWN248]
MEDMTDVDKSTEVLGYTLWAVLRRDPHRPALAGNLEPAVAAVEARGVTIRGFYDVSGMRADADIMIWLHGNNPEDIQWALRELRRSDPLASLLPTWNAMGVHRDAEFSKSHMPAFMRGKEPEAWLTVYPFVRSYEWYLLPDAERSTMLRDHGIKGSEMPQVLANTVASFALGDYEWMLALEAPELVDLVDLMRHLRQTDARLHVREEVPFYTGRRITLDEIAEVLA